MNTPDGWRLVPVEPTEAMLEAAHIPCLQNECLDILEEWHAMLAAAPVPPTGGNGEWTPGDEDVERLCLEFKDGFAGLDQRMKDMWRKDIDKALRKIVRRALQSLTTACATTVQGITDEDVRAMWAAFDSTDADHDMRAAATCLLHRLRSRG